MMQTLILSILLVAVYQFDELVRGVLYIFSRLMRRKYYQIALDTDHYVGTALTIATMPLLLMAVLLSEYSLPVKLLSLAGIYLAFAITSFGIHAFIKQLEKLKYYHGTTLAFAGINTLVGTFHPAWSMVPWNAGRERLTFAKLAFLLSLPPIVAVIFKWVYDNSSYQREVNIYFDSLIMVMVGGLFINIVIRSLEHYFRKNNIHVLGLFRVAIGLGVAFFLLL